VAVDRRQVLKGAMTGMLSLWAMPGTGATRQSGARRLSDRIAILDGGTNVVALETPDGWILVDSGAPGYGDALVNSLNQIQPGSNVHTILNTHYHLDHTGNNEMFRRSGAAIIAHARTRQWMSTRYWLPDEGRYAEARPEASWPTETFFNNGSMDADGERIDYGYLVTAHTGGDIYVYFRDSNVLAVGDVASPVQDPELDWITGGWIGGRVDAMDRLIEMADEETQIVPGSGPVMTYGEFRAERDMMEIVRQRLFTEVRAGLGAQEMLEAGVLDGLERTWDDPYTFLYAAARGLWGNHNKLDRNVV